MALISFHILADRYPYGDRDRERDRERERDRDRYPPDRFGGSRYPGSDGIGIGMGMGYPGRPYERYPDDYGKSFDISKNFNNSTLRFATDRY